MCGSTATLSHCRGLCSNCVSLLLALVVLPPLSVMCWTTATLSHCRGHCSNCVSLLLALVVLPPLSVMCGSTATLSHCRGICSNCVSLLLALVVLPPLSVMCWTTATLSHCRGHCSNCVSLLIAICFFTDPNHPSENFCAIFLKGRGLPVNLTAQVAARYTSATGTLYLTTHSTHFKIKSVGSQALQVCFI